MQGFVRLWERICKDFTRLWERIHKYSRDFGRGFTSIHENLGEDSQGIARLWERICKDLHKTLGQDS